MEAFVQKAMLLGEMLGKAMPNEKPIEFVRRLMMAECDKGDKKALESQYLNLPKDHGVYFQDTEQPLMNANDHVSNDHILQFGRCTSELNPKNMATKAIDDIVSNPLVKMVCPMANIVDGVLALKDMLGGGNCKCVPKTVRVWEETNEGNCMDGADGILNTSKLACCYGGIITIQEMKAGDDSDDSGDEEGPTKKTAMERMPQSVAESINSLNESGQESGESAESGDSGAGDGASSGSGAGGSGSSGGGASSGGSGSSGGGTSSGMISDGGAPGSYCTQEMVSQMQDWYAQADDFDQNYRVTGPMMISNYANNRCQEIPVSALNGEGYIADMSELTGFRMGGSSVALCGAGCVSAYNAMHALGVTQPLEDVIMSAELQQTVPGYMDQGPMAVSMMSTADMLQTMGFKTNTIRAESLLSGKMAKTMSEHNSIAIVGTTGAGGKAQFHTLKADRAGKLCCMENRSIPAEKLISKHDNRQMILGVRALN